MAIILQNMAFSGYRSFGADLQEFERFAKINLFIGANNSGKSNVLRFIKEVFGRDMPDDLRLLRHLNGKLDVVVGMSDEIPPHNVPEGQKNEHRLIHKDWPPGHQINVRDYLQQLFIAKALVDNTAKTYITVNFTNSGELDPKWLEAVEKLDDGQMNFLYRQFTGGSGQSRPSLNSLVPRNVIGNLPQFNVEFIPANRKVGDEAGSGQEYDGKGLINRLVVLQDPDEHSQTERLKFEKITKFLQTVLDIPDARIQIPHGRNSILVHIDGRVLPLSSLGSGIEEVIIIATAATVLDKTIICIEEPETHLNPMLQKKLLRYLEKETTNQYFIATHSAAIMDLPKAEIYHITHAEGTSKVRRVSSDGDKSRICEDLGYHPSDIIQANCVIWVEGPSDRIYLNYWIKQKESEFIEGVHYSIMFYGGRLASHLTSEDVEYDVEELDDFISLRKLNRRGVILMDSDRETADDEINSTKKRLIEKFTAPGYTWLTAGREIENYLPMDQIKAAVAAIAPQREQTGGWGTFSNRLKVKGSKPNSANKVKVANYIVKNNPTAIFTELDLDKRMDQLIQFIDESNGRAPVMESIETPCVTCGR